MGLGVYIFTYLWGLARHLLLQEKVSSSVHSHPLASTASEIRGVSLAKKDPQTLNRLGFRVYAVNPKP